MKTFILTIYFSNEKSWDNFKKLLKENFKNKQTNMIKISRFIIKKKRVTILKSPHVNKTAQEQFENRKKLVQMFIVSENFNKIIVTIKKLFNKLFSDIKLTIRCLTNDSPNKIGALNILKIINFKLNSFEKTDINKSFQTNKIIKSVCCKKKQIKLKMYLKALNSYGEIVV